MPAFDFEDFQPPGLKIVQSLISVAMRGRSVASYLGSSFVRQALKVVPFKLQRALINLSV